MMFLTVGGIKTDFQCADADSPVTDICRFDPEEKCFKPFRSLHDIYPEVGNKMGYSICTFGKQGYNSIVEECHKSVQAGMSLCTHIHILKTVTV